ncbi:MAG: hypothetical protein VXW65_02630, partial [Pseudomonadota bacterium]|nr:hypothetical protein [Pseudomonadota bacterium]
MTFSPDGDWLAFSGRISSLVDGVPATEGLFAKHLITGELIQINLDQDGQPFAQFSESPTFSPDGSQVAFIAIPIMTTADEPQVRQVYLKDLVTGALVNISANDQGEMGNATSDGYAPQFSPDGLSIVFASPANNLVQGDTNGFSDVFIKQLTGIPSSLDGGWDTVQASVSFILPDNVEDLVLLGSQALQGDGNASDNQIFGNEGNNKLFGHRGDDSLYGGDGDDVLLGGEGHDSLYGGAGDDVIYGGDGQDSLLGGSGDDTLYGDDGDDVLLGASGIDLLFGGEGHDQLHGGTGADYLAGDGGDDILYGDSGMDMLEGGMQDDLLYGGIGTDQLYGGDGD